MYLFAIRCLQSPGGNHQLEARRWIRGVREWKLADWKGIYLLCCPFLSLVGQTNKNIEGVFDYSEYQEFPIIYAKFSTGHDNRTIGR